MTDRRRPLPRLPFTLISLAVLAACGGGASDSEALGPMEAEHCADFETADAGAYMVENNVWNRGNVTDYLQCVDLEVRADGSADVILEWDWPAPGGYIRAYPEIIHGLKPWYLDSTTSVLPRRLVDVMHARAHVDASMQRTGGSGNLAFDIWLTHADTRAEGAVNLPLAAEVMIWLEQWGNVGPTGTRLKRVRVDGRDWDLYRDYGSFGSDPRPILTFHPAAPVVGPVVIDVRAFLDRLVQEDLITGEEWLASIELGNEVVDGAGRTRLRGYRVEIE